MTPAAIRVVSQLRQEFYALFAAAMKVSVSITRGNASTSNPSMGFWLDRHQQLNYVYVYAYTAPDELVPERPLVLRVAINRNVGIVATAKRGKGCQGVNQNWHFELTLLPEEILDFLPWIVALVRFHDDDSAHLIPEPPHPLDLKTVDKLRCHNAQTYTARSKLAQRVDERSLSLATKP